MTRKIVELMCFILLAVSCVNLQEDTVSFHFTSDGKPLRFDRVGMFAELKISVDLLEFFKDKDPTLKIDIKDIKKSIEDNIIKQLPKRYQSHCLDKLSEQLSKLSTRLGEKISREEIQKLAVERIEKFLRRPVDKDEVAFYFINIADVRDDQDLQQDEQGQCYVNIPKPPSTGCRIYYPAQVTGVKGPIRVHVAFTPDIVKKGKNIPVELPKLDASITAKIVNTSDAPVPLLSLDKKLAEEEEMSIFLQIMLCKGEQSQEENISLKEIPSIGEIELILRKKISPSGVAFTWPPTWFVDVPKEERILMLEEAEGPAREMKKDIVKKFQINPGKNDLGEIKLFQLVYPFKLQIKLKEGEKEEILFEGSERFSGGRYFKFEFYNPEMDWTFVTGQLSGHLPKKGEYILKIGVEVDKIKTKDDRVLKIKPVEKEVKIKIESKEENTFTIYFEPEE